MVKTGIVLADKVKAEKVGLINEKINVMLKSNYDAKINKKQKIKSQKHLKIILYYPHQINLKFILISKNYINSKESRIYILSFYS